MSDHRPVPSINVNFEKCDCWMQHQPWRKAHQQTCAARHVLIPCPMPRSVTFTVRLGMCTCADHPEPGDEPPHLSGCPARPIRVSLSISGKTWKESRVDDFDLADTGIYPNDALRTACRERWEFVKALVAGERMIVTTGNWPPGSEQERLVQQRDAVFAALADMARAEKAHSEAVRALVGACPGRLGAKLGRIDPCIPDAGRFLVRYVEHLIERSGILGVAP